MKNIREKLLVLFEMQDKANILTNGEDWKDGFTEDGYEINWKRCMRYELVEAVDQSFGWKHWKNIEGGQYSLNSNGRHNLKIELVDTLHFLMSEVISQEWMENLLDESNNLDFYKIDIENKNLITQIEGIERLIFSYEDDNSYYAMRNLFNTYWKVTLSVMDFDELYRMYVLKNTLNIFRQDNGYKDGSYIKNWGKDQVEDNMFLEKYINSGGKIEYKDITLFLEKTYKKENK